MKNKAISIIMVEKDGDNGTKTKGNSTNDETQELVIPFITDYFKRAEK